MVGAASGAAPLLRLLWFSCAAVLLSGSGALGSVVARHRGEGLHPEPAVWKMLGRVGTDEPLLLTAALRNTNLDQLRRTAEAVSKPHTATYGKYLSLEEVAELTAPPRGALEEVTAFFESLGGTVSPTLSGDFVRVQLTAGQVERAFASQGVRVHAFRHRHSGRRLVRAVSREPISLPPRVEDLLDIVVGLQEFVTYPRERRMTRATRVRDGVARGEGSATTPTTSAPDFVEVRAGPGDLVVQLLIYCQNGQLTGSAAQPCSDFPPALASVTLTISPRGHPDQTSDFPLAELRCSAQAGLGVVCVLPVVQFPQWQMILNTTVMATFSDGSVSPTFVYGTPIAPSPYVSPTTIKEYYGVPRNFRGTNSNNSQAVTAFEEQYVSITGDLKEFFQYHGLPFQAPTIVGPNDPSSPGGESSLDLQYVSGVGAGVPTTFFSLGGPGPTPDPPGAFILDWALAVANMTNPPLVTSISYGDDEAHYWALYGNWTYIDRMEIELQKMAVRGLTVIAGSGDAGVSNVGELGNDLGTVNAACTPFAPFYPSDSPWVLSVGSSYLTPNALPVCFAELNVTVQPVVCTDMGESVVSLRDGIPWTSGGGFSNYSARPSYQDAAVANFFAAVDPAVLPPSQYYNRAGRAYPDLVTVGHNLMVVWGGRLLPVDGTSASGPVLAGLVSLLNEVRLSEGLPTVGHINPLLYELAVLFPDCFFDVTVGSNFDGDHELRGSPYAATCPYGFSAQPGYDPASGLGSPNWDALHKIVTSAALFTDGGRV